MSSWMVRVILLLLLFPCFASGPQWYFDEPPALVTNFLASALAARTRGVYGRELGKFARQTPAGEGWHLLANQQKDDLLSQYLVGGFSRPPVDFNHVSVTHAGYVVSAMKHFHPLNEYRLSRKVFQVIRKKAPPKGAWPLTKPLLEALAGGSLSIDQPEMSICAMLTYPCLLRVGETLDITWERLMLAEDRDSHGVVFIPTSKTGVNHWVPISDIRLLGNLRGWRLKRGAQAHSVCSPSHMPHSENCSHRYFPYSG